MIDRRTKPELREALAATDASLTAQLVVFHETREALEASKRAEAKAKENASYWNEQYTKAERRTAEERDAKEKAEQALRGAYKQHRHDLLGERVWLERYHTLRGAMIAMAGRAKVEEIEAPKPDPYGGAGPVPAMFPGYGG